MEDIHYYMLKNNCNIYTTWNYISFKINKYTARNIKNMAQNNKEESIEKQLWKLADKLRKNIDAAEYKHIVLGLIFIVLSKTTASGSGLIKRFYR